MHQISLLNGLGTARHGGASHFMRPDRVYATGVISPMTGYRPSFDAMGVAQEFTLGPQTGMTLSGLRGPSLLDRAKAWWHGVKARASGGMSPRAAVPAQAPTIASEPVLAPPGHAIPPGHAGRTAPAAVTALMVGPHTRGIPDRLVSRAWGQSTSLPPFAEEAAAKSTMMAWRGLRWPWG